MVETERRELSKREFIDGYVDAYFPGLTGYGYQGDFISETDAKAIMQEILDKIDWIEEQELGHPILHMQDGRELFVDDTNDFPRPTSEEIDGYTNID